tara:strand:+ start:1925 stop:2392 length:468 start_codon:yes stop_codon:yes gene_type:complete
MHKTSNLIILTFIVTALFDVVLRFIVENYDELPSYVKEYKFLKYLIPYFKKHTLLSAALIAGFIGAITQFIILKVVDFPNNKDFNYITKFLLLSFIISGLFGFIMKLTKLFPHLDATYYKNLGNTNGAIHDGVSGLIVQITLLLLYFYIPSIRSI